jgi:hypothetical protein
MFYDLTHYSSAPSLESLTVTARDKEHDSRAFKGRRNLVKGCENILNINLEVKIQWHNVTFVTGFVVR